MKEAIDEAVSVLVGLPLSTDGRAVEMVTFGFGPTHEEESRGRMRTVAVYALHVQCSWRMMRDASILTGYRDWLVPPAGVSADGFDPSEARLNHRDELLKVFRGHGLDAHVVERAEGAPAGDLRIAFADGCVLEVLPDFAAPDEDGGGDEYWRMFSIGNIEEHFVVTAHGIST